MLLDGAKKSFSLFYRKQSPTKPTFFAEKLQEKLQNHLVNYEDEQISVRVSMGIEQFKENQTIDKVINNADKYLYQAKNSGKNQIFPKF